MINPDNLIELDYNNEKIEILKIDHLPDYDIEDYDLFDEKDLTKYLYDVERLARTSFEYRAMIKYLRENMDMNKCSFYSNVNNIDTFKIKIHVHHHPFTLYDISLIVFRKRAAYHESLDPEMVAKEVMYLHYKLMIGLIPLSETVHELVHNSYIFIPTDKVYGRFQEFVNIYEEFIPPEMMDTLERIKEYTNNYNETAPQHEAILSKHYVYLDVTGAYNLPTLQNVIEKMNIRIKQIKNGDEMVENAQQPLINPITKI